MNYKIVKKISERTGNELFIIYKRTFFGLFWREVGVEVFLEDAEKRVVYLKTQDEWKRKAKKKPEVIGYY